MAQRIARSSDTACCQLSSLTGCLNLRSQPLKAKIPSRLSILVAISWSLILKKAVTAKPEYEEIFEMMHSSAFINAAKGTIF